MLAGEVEVAEVIEDEQNRGEEGAKGPSTELYTSPRLMGPETTSAWRKQAVCPAEIVGS